MKTAMDNDSRPIFEYVLLGLFAVALLLTIILKVAWGALFALIVFLIAFFRRKQKKGLLTLVTLILPGALLVICVISLIVLGIGSL